ncbi:envelope protein UL20 [Equid alphaherpesvirus 3]|uniref:Envelope protein UL20 n=1 Tax=Equid alphaherpesvirus 3 TaxID=80341 RepID=A0A077B7L4_9ALPH|nr:envelope protein UL20 [Equid alphaherpesvirus 3]AIL02959.1 envelope protein UL20 [Equid alphaherpesvirus 3]
MPSAIAGLGGAPPDSSARKPLLEAQAADDGASSAEDEELYECVAMSAYGGDADFLVSSAGARVPSRGQPAFSVYVVLFALSAFVVKPACCLVFLNYYVMTGSSSFVVAGGAATLVYYARLALMAWFMLQNIRADRLPLRLWQQIIVCGLAVGRTAAFLFVTYTTIFAHSELFFRILDAGEEGEYITPIIYHRLLPLLSVRAAVCLVIIATAVYAADAVCDTIGFALPRVWICVLMKSHLLV